MRLVHTDVNGDKHPVSKGYEFGHGPDMLQVVIMNEPHKASSSGKMCIRNVLDDHETYHEVFTHVYDMEWIEREDRGWLSDEDIFGVYENIFGVDLTTVKLDEAIAFIRTTTIASFPDNRLDDMMIIKRWLDKQ